MKISLRNALRLVARGTAAGTILFSLGCASTAPAPTAPPAASASLGQPLLKVGVTADLPPMVFRQGGQLVGVEIDLARQLAATMGRTVKFVEVPWDGQIEALLSGKTDVIMSGMSVTAARSVRVDFSLPYLRAGQNALVRRSEANRVQLLMGTKAMKLGVQKSTTSDFFVQQNVPKAERVVVKSPKAAAEAVISGKIDAFICDATVNWWLAAEYEAQGLTVLPGLLTEEYLAWGFRKGDAELLGAANKFVEAARADGRLEAIAKRWLPFAQ